MNEMSFKKRNSSHDTNTNITEIKFLGCSLCKTSLLAQKLITVMRKLSKSGFVHAFSFALEWVLSL